MNGARMKFNSGMGAILCSSCNIILRTFADMTNEEYNKIQNKEFIPKQH